MKKLAVKEAIKKQLKIVNFKSTENMLAKMKENAEKYYNGNLSGWIKYAALNHRPKRSEMIEVE